MQLVAAARVFLPFGFDVYRGLVVLVFKIYYEVVGKYINLRDIGAKRYFWGPETIVALRFSVD